VSPSFDSVVVVVVEDGPQTLTGVVITPSPSARITAAV
jgi:hypothetical protein